MTPCRLVCKYKRWGEACYRHLQASPRSQKVFFPPTILKMEAEGFSRNLLRIYQKTRCHIPKYWNLYPHSSSSLKSCINSRLMSSGVSRKAVWEKFKQKFWEKWRLFLLFWRWRQKIIQKQLSVYPLLYGFISQTKVDLCTLSFWQSNLIWTGSVHMTIHCDAFA